MRQNAGRGKQFWAHRPHRSHPGALEELHKAQRLGGEHFLERQHADDVHKEPAFEVRLGDPGAADDEIVVLDEACAEIEQNLHDTQGSTSNSVHNSPPLATRQSKLACSMAAGRTSRPKPISTMSSTHPSAEKRVYSKPKQMMKGAATQMYASSSKMQMSQRVRACTTCPIIACAGMPRQVEGMKLSCFRACATASAAWCGLQSHPPSPPYSWTTMGRRPDVGVAPSPGGAESPTGERAARQTAPAS